MEVTAETLVWLAAAMLGLILFGFLLVAARRIKVGPQEKVRGRDRREKTGITGPRVEKDEPERIL